MKDFLKNIFKNYSPSDIHKESPPIFTTEWLQMWKSNINENNIYAYHGKTWDAQIIFKITEPISNTFKNEKHLGIYLNLRNGICHEIRYAVEEDEQISDIILKADERTWLKVLEQDGDPTKLIMLSKIKLEKGSLVLLSTQRKAASELMKSAPLINHHINTPDISDVKHHHIRDRTSFKTTRNGLDHSCYPMKLFQKAKQYGVWNPTNIHLEKDTEQWKCLEKYEKEIILHLLSLFMAGEEAVTSDLLPLINVISREGRVEEEIYLTSFLWEEAKHVEFFSNYQQTVMGRQVNLERFHGPFYKTLFYEKLPSTLTHLNIEQTPAAQLKASITYNIIVEGTLAETGYEAFYNMLNERNLLPGLRKGITEIKQDESRHIAYGLFLINRLLNQNPELKHMVEEELTELLDDATNIIHEIFQPYDEIPFNLEKDWFLNYAIKQFQKRIDKLGLDV